MERFGESLTGIGNSLGNADIQTKGLPCYPGGCYNDKKRGYTYDTARKGEGNDKRMKKNRRYRAAVLALAMALALGGPGGAAGQTVSAADMAHIGSLAEVEIPARSVSSASSSPELAETAKTHDILALVYLCDKLEVHQAASLDSEATDILECGQTVFIQDAVYNESEGRLWVYASFISGDAWMAGYLDRQYLACSDKYFLDWEKESGIPGAESAQSGEDGSVQEASPLGEGQAAHINDSGITKDVARFPESYQSGLASLKKKHPQWIFVPMATGLEWSTAVTEELKGGRSLVYKTFPESAKNGAYDDGNWFYASRDILEQYMDPRNMLTEDRIFQFELLTYNKTYHTEGAVEKFLANTFMRSPANAPGTSMTYAHIFWSVGAESGREVSPFHLAARVYQEQGKGTSGLISGSYPGYEGYYNYFNVGATGTSSSAVIQNGLKYARDHGWNNAFNSIRGGADVIAANYIKKGQDTLYLQKFNVNPSAAYATYTHQYMQNISAPASEGSSMKKLYASADSLDNSFVFKIPVYNNMPGESGAFYWDEPAENIILHVPDGFDKNAAAYSLVWIDGIPYVPDYENDRWVIDIGGVSASSAVVYSYDSVSAEIPNGMYVWTIKVENGTYTVTEQKKLKDLFSYHGFSIRVSGDPGIRMKSGISEELKQSLAGSGVNGFKLKEYGMIVTEKSDLDAYPLVKDGTGVMTGMSYGTDAQGKKSDTVVETVDGRARFTSVLVGLPAAKFNTVYSFRSYAVLTKSSKNYVIYGPTVSRSISSLAKQILAAGEYGAGSEEELYLKDILQKAEEGQK